MRDLEGGGCIRRQWICLLHRYLMNTTKSCGISVQVTTSKQDALIRFEVRMSTLPDSREITMK